MSFFDEVIRQSSAFDLPGRCARLDLLEPVTRSAALAVLEDAARAGHEMVVWETYRSPQRQTKLYERGVTRRRTVGVHQYGLAFDAIFLVDGEPSWKGDFSLLGRLAAKHGLVWGGDWGNPNVKHDFIDADHLQRVSTADQPKLFAGTWYPDASYNPRG